jgi:hypothetical protein
VNNRIQTAASTLLQFIQSAFIRQQEQAEQSSHFEAVCGRAGL